MWQDAKHKPNLIVLPRAQQHWVLLLKAALRCFEVWWVRIEWECFPSQGSPFVAAWPRRGGSLWTRSQWRRLQGWSRPPARARWRRAGRQGRARPFLRTWKKVADLSEVTTRGGGLSSVRKSVKSPDIRQIDQQLIAYDVTLFLTAEMNRIALGGRLAPMGWGVGLAH